MSGSLLIILGTFLWALDTLIRYPLLDAGLSAAQIVFIEHFILTLIFLPLLYAKRDKFMSMNRTQLLCFIGVGAFGSALGTLAFTQAFRYINPSLVILLQKFQPLLTIGLAALFLKEPLKKGFVFWVILCLLGGITLSYNDISQGLDGELVSGLKVSKNALIGYGLALIAIISWAGATVFGKRLIGDGFTSLELTAGRFVVGLLALSPLLLSKNVHFSHSIDIWGKLFLMVMISGVFGMYFYYLGLKKVSAGLCALLEMFFPLSAVTVNWIFLDASLETSQLLGGALLLLGSTVIQLRRY